MPPAAAHADAASEQIHSATPSPQPVREVPAPGPTDTLDRSEGAGGVGPDPGLLAVDDARTETLSAPGLLSAARGHGIAPARPGHLPVLFAQRTGNRLAHIKRTDREALQRRRVADDGFVAQAGDEFPAHARVHGRHKTEPQTRETRAEQGDRNHDPADTGLARVFAHQFAVGDPSRSADFKHGAALVFDIESVDQVRDDIIDRDGLGRGPHPAWRDHHR